MQPAELAAILARETDAGVAGAMAAVDAARVLTLDHVVARVGSVPDGTDVDWAEVTWQAELHFRGGDGAVGRSPGGPPAVPTIPSSLATLPVRALVGVGTAWTRTLVALGVTTVGALAALPPATVAEWGAELGAEVVRLVGRARATAVLVPEVPRALVGRTVVDIARGAPEGMAEAALWSLCVGLLTVLDEGVLTTLRVDDLSR